MRSLLPLLTLLILFVTTQNSLLIGAILITLILATVICLCLLSPWLTYTIFLVFAGGVIILFMYVISLANNENIGNVTTLILPFLTLVQVPMLPENIIFYPESSVHTYETITLISIAYLFLILTAVINVIYNNKTPIRNIQ